MMKKSFNNHGFTLIELIIVIAIIALLAAAAFVAVDPAKRVGEARDAQRWADITAIADAYMTYLVDNAGTAATSTILNGEDYFIQHTAGVAATDPPDTCAASTTVVSTGSPIDLHALVTAGYIGDIPDDPGIVAATDDDGTGYYFYKDSTGKIIVGACRQSYAGNDITVIR